MIEIKKMFEEDSFDICGYYSDGHVDKEEFVDLVVEHIKEDIEEGAIYLMDEESEFLLTRVDIDEVKYLWYREEEIDDDSPLGNVFWFSDRAREGYSPMTRYYL